MTPENKLNKFAIEDILCYIAAFIKLFPAAENNYL